MSLAEAARRGSRSAFETLVEQTQPSLCAFLRARGASPDDAEEIAQEAYLRAWRRIRRYDSRWRFSTWLFTIAWRLLVSRRRRPRLPLVEDEGHLPSGDPGPERRAHERELERNVWRLARRVLTEDQGAALWLRYAEDFSAREIGAVLGKRESAVRVLLHRARERLAAHLRAFDDERRAPQRARRREVRGAPAPAPAPGPARRMGAHP